MKTLKLIGTGFIVLAVAAITLSGCKKDNNDNKVDTARMQQTNVDNRLMSASVDDASNDVNKVLSGGGGKSMDWVPCHATLDSVFTIADTVTYKITYNGLNCNGNFNREGVVWVHKNVNTHWIDAGATVYVLFDNLKVTKVSTGKWAIINGTKVFVNVSGGVLAQLGGTLTSITHRVTGSLTATFDDNSQRVWNIARNKTFTGISGDLSCTFEGLGAADGYTNLEAWGTNRHGDLYYNRITTAIVCREGCDGDPVSGSGIISIPADLMSATLTFGYDSNEQPVNGGACPTKYKVDWTKGSNYGTLYLSL
jgi:hypothetical protein